MRDIGSKGGRPAENRSLHKEFSGRAIESAAESAALALRRSASADVVGVSKGSAPGGPVRTPPPGSPGRQVWAAVKATETHAYPA
ncbi:hypothetical protein [Microbispora rosea]|uniref:hypothetical protein n=1 Tax=Microbispora rosea TaxID=58117 RepID=UPI0034437C48